METLRATVSAPVPAAIAQLRDPEPTRSVAIPANSRARAHDEPPEGRATEHYPASSEANHSLTQSLPNSQESNHSFSSFVSSTRPRFQASSSNLSQTTELTIPSSVASFDRSTQGESQKEMSRVSHAPQVSSADWRPIPAGFPVTPFVDTHVEDGAIAHSTSNDASPTSRTSPSSLGGTKRTSSGTMKRPASSHGVASDYQPGHSRTNSAQSSTSRTGGLAAELKTKLTYAMLKVNNGWQRNTLDQIEQLAIQKASPTSATFPESVSRRAYASPHSSAPSMMRRVSRGSSDSDSYLGSPNTAVFSPFNGSNLRFAGKMSPPQQTNAWPSRPFPQNPYAAAAAAAAPRVIAAHSNLAAATSNPVLAPAADISSPSRSRRAEMPSYKPPNLPGSHRKQPSTSGAPRTPNQNPRTTLIRTPTEQARAEKDALDTLMFMSSPGNSVYYGHTGQGSHGQPSPLGTQVRKAAAFESKRPIQTTGQSKSNSSTGASPGGLARGYVQAHKPQEAVARILDEMEDEDSDNEGGHGPRAIQT